MPPSRFTKCWRDTQSGAAKVILELTPHKQYTRTDCPRYGELAGASCANGPAAGPSVIDSLERSPGTEEQRRRFAELLGMPVETVALAQLLGLAPPEADPTGEPR